MGTPSNQHGNHRSHRAVSPNPYGDDDDDHFSGLLEGFGKAKKRPVLTLDEQAARTSQRPQLAPKQTVPSGTPDPWDFDLLAQASSSLPNPTAPVPEPPASQPGLLKGSDGTGDVLDSLDDILGPLSKAPAASQARQGREEIPLKSESKVLSGEWTVIALNENNHRKADPERRSADGYVGIGSEDEAFLSSQHSPGDAMPTNSRNPGPPSELLKQLISMGFTPSAAQESLEACDFDLQASVDHLLRKSSSPLQQPSRHTPNVTSLFDQTPPATLDDVKDSATKLGMEMWKKANWAFSRSRDAVKQKVEEINAAGGVQRVAQQHAAQAQNYIGNAGVFLASQAERLKTGVRQKSPGKWYQSHDSARCEFRDESSEGEDGREVFDVEEPQEEPNSFVFADLPSQSVPWAQPAMGESLTVSGSPRGPDHRKRRSSNAPVAAKAPSPAPPNTPPTSIRKQQCPLTEPRGLAPTFPALDPVLLENAMRIRTEGNEAFKLGQFAEAAAMYTRCLELLPGAHLLRIPLLNNRALALSRNSHYSSAISDCDAVVRLFRHYQYPTGPLNDGHTVVKPQDFVKALIRKAHCLEATERYEDAKMIYQTPIARRFSETQAREGYRRCERALNPEQQRSRHPTLSSTNSKGTLSENQSARNEMLNLFDSPLNSSGTNSSATMTAFEVSQSQAVQSLRAEKALKNSQEEERFRVRDDVDARVQAWKTGKELNLRALLGSLNTILWPELQWQSVSLASMVNEKQVKVQYMKAIAKLHPDKMPNDLTPEQQLIAESVFGTLNKAWDSFRAENHL